MDDPIATARCSIYPGLLGFGLAGAHIQHPDTGSSICLPVDDPRAFQMPSIPIRTDQTSEPPGSTKGIGSVLCYAYTV